MIVAFEGLPCACKSSIVDRLAEEYDNAYAVPEFVIDPSYGISDELCIINDIAKSNLAKHLDSSNKFVFLDRSLYSTLVYAQLESPEAYNKISKKYSEQDMQTLLHAPDLIIYLRITPKVSTSRAVSVDRFNERFAWYRHTNKAFKIYEELFANNQKINKCHVRTIDAEIDFESLRLEVVKAIDEFQDA